MIRFLYIPKKNFFPAKKNAEFGQTRGECTKKAQQFNKKSQQFNKKSQTPLPNPILSKNMVKCVMNCYWIPFYLIQKK